MFSKFPAQCFLVLELLGSRRMRIWPDGQLRTTTVQFQLHTHTHSIRIVTNQKSVPIFAFFLATKAFTSSTWSCPSFLSTSKRTSNHYDKKLKFPFFRTSHGALHLIQHLQLTQQFAIMEKRQNYNYSKAISFFRVLLSKVFLFL